MKHLRQESDIKKFQQTLRGGFYISRPSLKLSPAAVNDLQFSGDRRNFFFSPTNKLSPIRNSTKKVQRILINCSKESAVNIVDRTEGTREDEPENFNNTRVGPNRVSRAHRILKNSALNTKYDPYFSSQSRLRWRISAPQLPDRFSLQVETRTSLEAQKQFQLSVTPFQPNEPEPEKCIETVEKVPFSWEAHSLKGMQLQNLPSTVGASFTQIGNNFFLFGGTAGQDHSGLYNYEPSSGTWRVSQVLSERPNSQRAGHSAFGYRNKMYLFGGEEPTISGNAKLNHYNDLWSYDPTRKAWLKHEVSGEKISARSFHASCFHNSKLTVYGGINQSGEYLDDIYTLDLGRDIILFIFSYLSD